MSALSIIESRVLPLEMRTLSQWVNWRYEVRKGKRTKVPYNPHTLLHASSTNPDTWSTFEHAQSRVSNKTGLGFVLIPPWIGIDLDHCVHEDGSLSLLAQEILVRFPLTYKEVSPSGLGVHMFLLGILPRALKTSLGEMYTSGRFFTVTGRLLKEAHPHVSAASDADVVWLVAKLTPKTTRKSTNGAVLSLEEDADEDRTPLRADSHIFAALCLSNPNWRATWERSRTLDGPKGDQSDSAYEMSLARMAVEVGVEDCDVYALLVGWRIDQRLPAKHHKALVLTIENAHKEHKDAEQEKALDTPEKLTPLDKLATIQKLLHLPIVRLVQMGRGDAHYRAHLSTGVVLDLGNYTGFKNVVTWERYVWEYAGKHLYAEKKRWAKICRLLLSFCEVEESEELSQAAETRSWLSAYLSDLMRRDATASTLKQSAPFVDTTGSYLQLDAFLKYTHIHCGAKVTRSMLAGRLRVLGWAEVGLTRTDEKSTLTRNYWYRAH